MVASKEVETVSLLCRWELLRLQWDLLGWSSEDCRCCNGKVWVAEVAGTKFLSDVHILKASQAWKTDTQAKAETKKRKSLCTNNSEEIDTGATYSISAIRRGNCNMIPLTNELFRTDLTAHVILSRGDQPWKTYTNHVYYTWKIYKIWTRLTRGRLGVNILLKWVAVGFLSSAA